MSANRERRPDGTYSREYDEGDVLDAVREIGYPQSTSRAVSEESGVPRRTALIILHGLEDEGLIKSETIGDSLVWKVVDE